MKVATNAICLSYHGVDADGKATKTGNAYP